MELWEKGEIPWNGASKSIGIYKDYVGSGARERKSWKISFLCEISKFMWFSSNFMKFHENEWKRRICITTTPTCPEPYIFLVVSYVFWSFAWAGNWFFHRNAENIETFAFVKNHENYEFWEKKKIYEFPPILVPRTCQIEQWFILFRGSRCGEGRETTIYMNIHRISWNFIKFWYFHEFPWKSVFYGILPRSRDLPRLPRTLRSAL